MDGWRKLDVFIGSVSIYIEYLTLVYRLLSEIENKPLNIYSLVSILLSEEAFPSERDMV